MHKKYFVTLFYLILFSFNSVAYAQRNAFRSPTFNLKIHQHTYTGEKNKSFADTGTGYGVSLEKLFRYDILVPYFGISMGTHSGKQSFLDDKTEKKAYYLFQYGAAEVGAYLFPAGRQVKGMSFYVKGAGLFGYNALSIDSNIKFTKLTNSEQNYSGGYKGAVGLEWIFNRKSKYGKWSFYGEVGFKKEQTVLAKQNFSLDTLTYSLGLGW